MKTGDLAEETPRREFTAFPGASLPVFLCPLLPVSLPFHLCPYPWEL